MNKILFCLLIAGLLVTMPVLSACGGAKETTTTPLTTSTPPTTTSAPPTTTTTTPPTTTTTEPPTTNVVTWGEAAITGEIEYAASCAGCHGSAGGDGIGSSLGSFTKAEELSNYISTQMPSNAPGSLSDSTYLQILAHILIENSFIQPEEILNEDGLGSITLTEPPSTTTTTTTMPPTTTPPITTTTGETLGEILGRSAGITSVKYDMLVTSPGVETITTKVWIKNNKMRMEMTAEGQLIITLLDMDAQTMYLYYPDQNMAMKVTYEPTESAMEEAQSITDYNPTIIGTETMDGKVCLVVEYNIEGQAVKMWIWKDKGFPIRVEMATTEGTIVVEYKNIEFVDIPDSTFQLPEGVEIIEIPGM